jgi:acetyl-CoA carboxylase carboxyltransferase component
MSGGVMSGAAVIEREERVDPVARLESLCDPGSLELLRTGVVSKRMGDRARADDGVLAGAGTVGGRPVFCYAQDPSYLGGSLGEVHADSILRVMDLGGRHGAPVVGFVQSGGARLQEGHAALSGYGRIFRRSVKLSRLVPQITVVSGVSAGGGAYSPALTDFVIMTEPGRMFLTGPRVVEAALGEQVSMEDLGGPRLHGKNGVSDFAVGENEEAVELTRELIGLFPGRLGDPAPRAETRPPLPGSQFTVPAEARKVYDIRDVARSILDGGELVEPSPRWARNIVTGLGRIDGRSVAIVANQPRWLGGVIDAAAAEKAARFIERCNRFGLPLVVLVDTPGFMPGSKQEGLGVIRHGSDLLRAFAGASVPKLTVVIRKAYGGAAITMNSRDLGADVVFAWPGAEIGVMAAGQAVDIVHRRQLAADSNGLRDELVAEYTDEHLSAAAAAGSGFVDEVIEPASTRDRLARALDWLEQG